MSAIEAELAAWSAERKAFRAFVATHEDKIRKKLRVARDADAAADVRAELLVAFRLLGDRRFTVAFEAYGSGVRGPDLTVTFRAVHRFDLEVTRLRASSRVDDAVAAKLRQLRPSVPSVIALVGAPRIDGVDLSGAVRRLRSRAEGDDHAVLDRAGAATKREFFVRYLRCSAAAMVHDPADGGCDVWINAEARHLLPRGAAVALARCFSAM